ncbi:MAG: hypothetical protein QOJ35_1280 [Solirubrobacteraceae bacterium]|nr:hypothetical protein [Solirubrobacteraceae bacterium]
MSRTIRLLTLALGLGALLVPGAAHASPTQTSIMMDDDLLLYRDDTTAANALTRMRSLGVDTVRVTVLWKTVAENARPSKADIAKLKGSAKTRAHRQAARFKAANPATYPRRNWDRYDNLVKSATDRGIRVYFNVTGPGPAWAMGKAPAGLRSLAGQWKPKPSAFKQFVQAVGRRFDGTYRDENGSHGILPRVKFWSLWNEPNQAGWLAPQWENGVPASPALYRKLYQYGYRGLLASGHRVDTDIILMGETAPLGSDAQTERSPMRPGLFLREVACIQPDGTPYTGAAAAARSCGDFAARGPLIANGYAHHPYTKNVPPTVADPNPDALTMANISNLGTLLDDLANKTNGAIPHNLPLFMTEFGFETNPPDIFNGVSLADQAKFNTIGEYQAWQNPRIQSQAQFLLRDVAPVRSHRKNTKPYWFTYQSGLFFLKGSAANPSGAKPAAAAYAMPFLAFNTNTLDPTTGAPIFNLWGQLRLLNNGAPASATIQWRAKDGSTPWISVGDAVPIDEFGYFTGTRTAPLPVPGEWRSALLLADGSVAAFSPGTQGT